MKLFRAIFLAVLLTGVIGTSFALTQTPARTPFTWTLAPLFLELGKPLKTVDRALSKLSSVEEIDEKMLGEEIKAMLAKVSKPSSRDEEIAVNYLNALIKALSSETKKSFDYQVFLLEGPPNAYAMPGGALVVTKELLNMLDNEAELVAILSHEIGHVERGHTFDGARRHMLAGKVTATSIFDYASTAIHAIVKCSFSKSQEDEADEYSFRMMVQKGYDCSAVATCFEKLLAKDSSRLAPINPIEDFFKTHPHIELRLEKFRSRAQLFEEHYPHKISYLGKENLKKRITFFEEAFPDEYLSGK